MSDFDHKEWRENVAATENLQSLKKWQLKKYLRYFTKVQEQGQLYTQSQEKRDTCKERIELIRRELDQRRVIKPAWIGAVAGTVAAVVTIILSVQECSRPSSIPSEARPTPMATPQPSATETPSQ
jgi:hypothetical protein